MQFISFSWLKREVFKRSTLIAIPNLERLLDLSDDYSADEVFCSIARIALQEFEKYFPLYKSIRVFINPKSGGRFTFIDNFLSYLDGNVPEDSISLIPNTVLGVSLHPSTTFNTLFRSFRYENPELSDFYFPPDVYFVRGLFDYPIIEEFTEVSNCQLFSDRAGIYLLPSNGPQWKIFYDELYLQLCRYIVNLRKNIEMPNLPISLFQGLEEDYNKLEASQQTIYQQNLGNGNWYV